MKQIPAPLWTLVIGVLVTLISLWVGQSHHLLPEQASVQAPMVDGLFNLMLVMGTALFLLVEGAIVYSLIRFRRRKGDDTDGLPIEGNLPLEAFWTAIPAMIVIGLGIYSVVVFQEMGGFGPGHHHDGAMVAQVGDAPLVAAADPEDPAFGFGANPDRLGTQPDVVVDVSGMQYAWIFTYPDTGIVDGELHIPVGQEVQLRISAQDVIHSFWVPQFRLKQDAMPGEVSQLQFVATKEGTYPVICTELCGAYHGGMRTQVIVHSADDYADWVHSRVALGDSDTTVAKAATELSDRDYLALATHQAPTASVVEHLGHAAHANHAHHEVHP